MDLLLGTATKEAQNMIDRSLFPFIVAFLVSEEKLSKTLKSLSLPKSKLKAPRGDYFRVSNNSVFQVAYGYKGKGWADRMSANIQMLGLKPFRLDLDETPTLSTTVEEEPEQQQTAPAVWTFEVTIAKNSPLIDSDTLEGGLFRFDKDDGNIYVSFERFDFGQEEHCPDFKFREACIEKATSILIEAEEEEVSFRFGDSEDFGFLFEKKEEEVSTDEAMSTAMRTIEKEDRNTLSSAGDPSTGFHFEVEEKQQEESPEPSETPDEPEPVEEEQAPEPVPEKQQKSKRASVQVDTLSPEQQEVFRPYGIEEIDGGGKWRRGLAVEALQSIYRGITGKTTKSANPTSIANRIKKFLLSGKAPKKSPELNLEKLQAEYLELFGKETRSKDPVYLSKKIEERKKNGTPEPRQTKVDIMSTETRRKLQPAWSKGHSTYKSFVRNAVAEKLCACDAHDLADYIRGVS